MKPPGSSAHGHLRFKGYIDRAVSLENTTFFRDAGLNQPVYAGILQNTPHKDSSEAFLKLLLQ